MKTKQQSTEEKGQAHQKPHGTQAHKNVQGLTNTGTRTPRQKIQEEFKSSSSSRQLQPISKNMQQTNMLWSSAAGMFHMALPSFSWPLGSSIIGSSSYLSSTKVTTTLKTSTTRCKTIPKQSSDKLSTSWTAKPWQLWKLLHTSSNESTCVQLHASDIQLVTSENSWHQIPKHWNEHHMNWHHKTWKSNTVATGKDLQTYEQLLQDVGTASANRTG